MCSARWRCVAPPHSGVTSTFATHATSNGRRTIRAVIGIAPSAPALAQERWIAARAEKLLPVGHYHAVFTVPSELRPLAHQAPRAVYDALFQAASETLQELGRTRADAMRGITMVLHTWTRELGYHPHVHAIVTAGGLTDSGWKPMSLKYLFPVEVMGELLRGKMQTRLRELHRAGQLQLSNQELERLMQQLNRHERWVVYVKKAFRHAEHVLKYLGRYTHRVAISNGRLVAVGQDHVTFRTKNGQTVTLEPAEFLRRFIQHVLPKGLQKIRHYGLYAAATGDALAQARALLHGANSDETRVNIERLRNWQAALKELTGSATGGTPCRVMPLPLINKSSAQLTQPGMALCNRQNSRANGLKIPPVIAFATAASRPGKRLGRAASHHPIKFSPRFDTAPKAICIAPSKPDRACSTHALHVACSTHPVTVIP